MTGVTATEVGLSTTQVVATAVLIYSPTVSLTAFDFIGSDALAIVLVGASLVVGVRFALLSLSIASYFERVATSWKWPLAYVS